MGFFDSKDILTRITTDCGRCKLYTNCNAPKIVERGSGKNGIMLLLPPPSKGEDAASMCGENGLNRWLFNKLREIGIDPDECVAVNSIGCYTGTPKPAHALYCKNRFDSIISKYKPKLIISFGSFNLNVTIKDSWSRQLGDIIKWRGFCIPYRKHNCWLMHTFSPKEILFQSPFLVNERWKNATSIEEKEYVVRNNANYKMYMRAFYEDIRKAYFLKDTTIPEDPSKLSPARAISESESLKWLEDAYDYFSNNKDAVLIGDIETNALKPFDSDKFIYSIGLMYKKSEGAVAFKLTEKNTTLLKKLFSLKPKIRGANWKFDWLWLKSKLDIDAGNLVDDIIVQSHLNDNRDGITSLKFQTFVQYGISYEDTVHKYLEADGTNACNNISKAPLQDLLYYNALDVVYTDYCLDNLCKEYDSLDIPNKYFAKKLYHKGSIALAKMELAGMHIDLSIAEDSKKICDANLEIIDKKIENEPDWIYWKKLYGEKASLLSDAQVVDIYIKRKNLWPTGISKKEKPRADHEFLSKMIDKAPFLKYVLEKRKWEKNRNTYLESYFVETNKSDSRIRCFYTASGVSSHRMASRQPNLTNQASRSPEQVKLLKSCFTPKDKDHVIISVDFSGLENYVSANITGDPYMKGTLSGGVDMHKDNALYMFSTNEEEFKKLKEYDNENHTKLAKALRNGGKTCSFSCLFGCAAPVLATSLWKAMDDADLHVTTTEKAKDRVIRTLRMKEKYDATDKSIPYEDFCYNEYEKFAEGFLKDFWENRMKVTKEWREENWDIFVTKGRLNYPVGLSVCGIMSRNSALNAKVQGSAAACTLFSILRTQYYLDKNKAVDAVLIGQIHDAILAEVHRKDVHKYIELVLKAMCEDTQKAFPFLEVQLQAEAEISERSWAEAESYDPERDYTIVS